jgi:predicted site-specific integrase-resolvase
MTKREASRKAQVETESVKNNLKNQISQFINQTKGLTQKEIYDLFNKHDDIWIKYARSINNGRNSKIIIIHEDAFEEAIINMHQNLKSIEGIPKNELAYYNHIAEMFRPSTKWEKFVREFKKLFK